MRTPVVAIIAVGLLAGTGTAPADQGVAVGEERIVLRDGPGEGLQATPAVACGEKVYLVVWREGWHGEGGRARIFAARVSPKGAVLDPRGIEVAPVGKGTRYPDEKVPGPFSGSSDRVQTRPRVAFGGGVFLVVWQDLRKGKDLDVLAARVSPEGVVLDKAPIAIATGPGAQALPDVASDGDAFLVAWQGFDAKANTYHGLARPVTAAGALGKAVTTGAAPQVHIAWGGETYLAVYGGGALRAVRLKKDGTPINPTRWNTEVLRRVKNPRAAMAGAPGKGWLTVVHRSRPDYWGWGGPGGVRCYLVLPDGTRDPSMDDTLKKDRAGNWGQLDHWLDWGGRKRTTWPWGQPAVAFDGTHFVAVWPRYTVAKRVMLVNPDLYAARVDGWKPVRPEDDAVAASEMEEDHPALASDGAGGLLCAYERRAPDGTCLIAVRALLTK